MDRNIAKEKIEKLLRLANNKGATEGEKATALEMAKKLSEKYGFKIIKASPVEQYTQPHVYQPASNALHTCIVSKSDFLGYNPDYVQAILSALGYRVNADKNYFAVGSHDKFHPDTFHEYYKLFKVRVVFRDLLKKKKESVGWWDKKDSEWAKVDYCFGIKNGITGTNLSSGSRFYNAGYEIGSKFRGMKFDW